MDIEHPPLPLYSRVTKGEDLASMLHALLEAGQTVVQAVDDEGGIVTYTLVSGHRTGVVCKLQNVGRRTRNPTRCSVYLVGQDGALRKYIVRTRRFRGDSWRRVDCPAHEVDNLRGTLDALLRFVAA